MCENNNHRYRHLRTDKFARWTSSEGRQIAAEIIDTYFCEKCLDQKEVKKEYNGSIYNSPDWAKGISISN